MFPIRYSGFFIIGCVGLALAGDFQWRNEHERNTLKPIVWYNDAMNRSFAKIISLITVFSISVAIVVGYISIARGTSYLTAEIEEKILITAEKFSNDFSAKFNHMEGMTDSLASHVTTTFDVKALKADPEAYLQQYEKSLSELIETNMNMVSNAHSLYVTFNPDLAEKEHEVWYAVVDGKVRRISADFQANRRDFQLPYVDDMVYFFEPQIQYAGVWTGPYYDKDIQEDVFSYSKAIYVDDLFIGVAGADINADDTIGIIEAMKLYPDGYSALLDENFQFVVYPKEDKFKEEQVIQKQLQEEIGEDSTKKSGDIKYSFAGEKKILGYAKMDNGWTMVIVQPQKAAYRPVESLTTVFLIMALILAVVLIAFLGAFSRPFIRRQTSLEAENREKDILLAYQSRQAKIGEMVGNITHQWKQPLNTIKLILANLLDSYRYDDLDEKRLQKSVDKVDGIIDKMSETITDFSSFLKPTKEKERFHVKGCIKSALSLMEESITFHKIQVAISCETDEEAFGYYNETVHVIFNILNNARDAIVSAGSVDRKIDISVVREGDMIKISIENPGDSIPAEIMPLLFEPYFTTKEEAGGTGLGLYISRQIIEDRMNGKVFIENVPGGVRCGVLIPMKGE